MAYWVVEDQGQQPALLTVTETAKILRLSRAYTYELVARGDIPAIRIGRRVIIPRKALERWLEANTVMARVGPAESMSSGI